MGVIKKHYEDVRLSDEQKAEIKYALKDRFPQYARTGSEREVINMENERITDTGARVRSHSKLKAGIAATAAAALLLTAGVAAIHRMETGISPGSAQTDHNVQTGYIDDDSSPYFANARTIYNQLAKRTADFEIQGIRYAEDCSVINRDTVLAAREQNIICDPQEGEFVSALELAAKLDEQLKEDFDIDLGELDFELWIDTNRMTPQYVFIYPDESHSSWYSFPRYEEKSGYIEDSSSKYYAYAKSIYNRVLETTVGFEVQGIRYTEDCAVINRDTVLAAREQNIVCDPQEGDFVNALEAAAMLDDYLKEDADIDLGELDFEIRIDTNSMSVQYVFVYPDESHSSWYSYPRYEEKQSGYIECEDEDNDYYRQAKTYYNCMAEIVANAEVNGYSYGESFVISRQTVLEARLNNIVPDESDFELTPLEIAAMLDNNYDLAEMGMDPGEIDFEILIYLRSAEPIYVLIYPDDSHENWYSYPRYEGNAGMEKDEAIYTAEAKDIYHCLAEITTDYQVQGRQLGVDCSRISRETVRSMQDITVFDESQPVSAAELAAKLNDRVYSEYSIVISQLDFEAMIDVNTMMPEYVFIYTDGSHETYYSYPPVESDGGVEFTTVTDSSGEPLVVVYPEGYNEDPESEYYAQAVNIHDTFFKALAEAKLDGDTQAYEKFAEIFPEKLRETYGDGLDDIVFDIVYEDLDNMLVSHYDTDFELYDIMQDSLTPQNVSVYVYIDDSRKQFFRCPDYNLVTVPDVTYLSRAEAESVLTEMGFKVVVKGVYNADFPENTVTAFSPGVGVTVTQGSELRLQYSLGPVNTDNAEQAERARKEAEKIRDEVEKAEKTKEEARRNETEADYAKAVTSVTMEIPE